MHTLRLAMAQINPTVGALKKNASKILRYVERARNQGADLVIFPELAVTGYPPEDLLLKPGFIEDNIKCLRELARSIRGITAVIGFVDRSEHIYNAAAIVHKGEVAAVYRKMFLPNYGVFDEERYFHSGYQPLNFDLGDVRVGVGICEDIWYPEGPASTQSLAGAQLIVNINASPFHIGKSRQREEILVARAVDNNVFVAYNNAVGGQDELVFDGQSMIVNKVGRVIARGKAFKEDLIVADLDFANMLRRVEERERSWTRKADEVRDVTLKPERRKMKKSPLVRSSMPAPPNHTEEVYDALVLGTRDYVKKNGFRHCVIALSGGVDSSVVAAVAASALGGKCLTCVFMPSKYTSKASAVDAAELARNFGVKLLTIPIGDTLANFLKILTPPLGSRPAGVTEENLQARIRGNIIMALSNKLGWLVLTTGNKSEMSVGYATLYGDMAGGFAVIKDVPKTLVYELASHVNERSGKILIPESVLSKPPSAELSYGQTDQDTLPPYDVLDPILKAYIEDDRSCEEIQAMGFKGPVVKKVLGMVDRSEYKRRQSPPGIKITSRAFGRDRRMPITNRYDRR